MQPAPQQQQQQPGACYPQLQLQQRGAPALAELAARQGYGRIFEEVDAQVGRGRRGLGGRGRYEAAGAGTRPPAMRPARPARRRRRARGGPATAAAPRPCRRRAAPDAPPLVAAPCRCPPATQDARRSPTPSGSSQSADTHDHAWGAAPRAPGAAAGFGAQCPLRRALSLDSSVDDILACANEQLPSPPADAFTAVEMELASLIRLDCCGEADPARDRGRGRERGGPRSGAQAPAPLPRPSAGTGAGAAGRHAPKVVIRLPKGGAGAGPKAGLGPASAGVQKAKLTLKSLGRTASMP
jgi:hypothetical protein